MGRRRRSQLAPGRLWARRAREAAGRPHGKGAPGARKPGLVSSRPAWTPARPRGLLIRRRASGAAASGGQRARSRRDPAGRSGPRRCVLTATPAAPLSASRTLRVARDRNSSESEERARRGWGGRGRGAQTQTQARGSVGRTNHPEAAPSRVLWLELGHGLKETK